MEFNISNMVFLCDTGDCEDQVDHRCCVKCDNYDDCLAKGWTCNRIDANKQIAYCEHLSIKFGPVL